MQNRKVGYVSLSTRGDVYYLDYYLNKKRHRIAVGKNLKDAILVASKINDKISRIKSGVEQLDHILYKKIDQQWILDRWSTFNYREKLSILFVLYEGKCFYCKEEINIPKSSSDRYTLKRAVIDHKIPVASGGDDLLSNLALSCEKCNRKKFDKESSVYITELQASKLTNEQLKQEKMNLLKEIGRLQKQSKKVQKEFEQLKIDQIKYVKDTFLERHIKNWFRSLIIKDFV